MLALASASALVVGSSARRRKPRPRPSINLYGETGLIDMPTAQSQPDGQITASYSQFGDTSRRNFTFQILPRLSGTLRYSTIKNWGGTRRRPATTTSSTTAASTCGSSCCRGETAGGRRWRSACATSSAPASIRPSTWWPPRPWPRTSP